MFVLTDRQREIAEYLLAGADQPSICARMQISPHNLRNTMMEMRHRLGVVNGPAMMARLRELNRNPADAAIEHCRRHPATWCSPLIPIDR